MKKVTDLESEVNVFLARKTPPRRLPDFAKFERSTSMQLSESESRVSVKEEPVAASDWSQGSLDDEQKGEVLALSQELAECKEQLQSIRTAISNLQVSISSIRRALEKSYSSWKAVYDAVVDTSALAQGSLSDLSARLNVMKNLFRIHFLNKGDPVHGFEQEQAMDPTLFSLFKPSGFRFDNYKRNAAFKKMGFVPPKPISTGTTIVGTLFKDGIVLGADSRATNDRVVADKRCIKLHYLSDKIFACGAGTAADIDQVTEMLRANLKLMELNSGRKPRVVAALRIAKQHLFKYMGYVGAYLIIAGFDITGPHLYSVDANGATTIEPFVANGSGHYAAMGILEKQFKINMAEAEAVELVRSALMAGMSADLYSGNSLRYAIITSTETKQIHDVVPDFCLPPVKELSYTYPTQTTQVLDRNDIKYEIVESMET